MDSQTRVEAVAAALAAQADQERAAAMAAYMKDRFAFFGVKAGPRRKAQREVLSGWRVLDADDLIAFADGCWDRNERELQYAACDVLRRHVSRLGADNLAGIERLIATKSWWDTVDALAARVVGPLVAAHPELRPDLDRWLSSGDLWLERAAILHQLGYRDETDEAWLFEMCLAHAASTEFFHRKAIGWALREYAKTAPDAVAEFVAAHDADLSGLSKREATKNIGG